jgi:hypothetical protein
MQNVDQFYGNFEYSTANWYILWHFGIFCCPLFSFPGFGMLYQETSGNPGFFICNHATFYLCISANDVRD